MKRDITLHYTEVLALISSTKKNLIVWGQKSVNVVLVAEIKESVIFILLNKIGILSKTSFKQLTNRFCCVIIKPQNTITDVFEEWLKEYKNGER